MKPNKCIESDALTRALMHAVLEILSRRQTLAELKRKAGEVSTGDDGDGDEPA